MACLLVHRPLVAVELDLDHEHSAVLDMDLGLHEGPVIQPVVLLDPEPGVPRRDVVKQLANLEVHFANRK
jgi:hypothetical protein